MDFSSYKTWRNIGIVIIALGFIIYLSTSLSEPKITMDPVEDAYTCVELYMEDATKGEEYMTKVTTTYYMQNKHSELDKFANIVAREIAKKSFE